MKVIILGGGLTGLAAGWKLTKAEIPVTIIEALDHVGGLAASFNWHGFPLDIGPHKLYPQKESILKFLQLLLPDQLQVHKKQSSVYIKDRLVGSPPTVKTAYHLFWPAVFAFFSYLFSGAAYRLKDKSEISYQDYVVARFGNYLFKHIFGPQAIKIWGEPSQLVAELGRIRLPYKNLFEVIKSAFLRKQNKNVSAAKFYYPKDGIGQLAAALAAQITANGGEIVLGQKPKLINLSLDGVEILLSNGKCFLGDIVVSTIAPDSLMEILNPQPPDQVQEAASKLGFRPLIVCYVAINKAKISPNHWIIFPETKFCFNRLYEVKSFTSVDTNPNETVIVAEITTEPKNLWAKEDKEILREVTQDLKATGLVNPNNIVDYKVVRIKRAYPLLNLGYAEKRQLVLDYLHSLPNILCVGRSGLFIYNNMDHSLEMGLSAAEHILSNSLDLWPKKANIFFCSRIVD